ncbi:myotubularin-related protein 14 isoform X2 [Cimex lectularius]|uniref:Myotubularin phosphatase domain-containing protein n=1 Tax=Cimex lectularius TaxID=79782 RepID=A0A8I6RR11_CIMLE|nr:myotubularin-related protein 14 isoform X2 [Cimex lectularius]
MADIRNKDIQKLLNYFSRNTFRAKDSDAKTNKILQRCIDLVSLDYSHVEINNTNGELSAHYPSKIIIMEYEKANENNEPELTNRSSSKKVKSNGTIYESVYDAAKLKELFGKARFARCRARFPLPVILYKGKNICRSATLSGGPEIYGRSGLDYLFCSEDTGQEDSNESEEEGKYSKDWQLCDRVRNQDIKLLKTLNVGAIIDFMVEKKKVKFGVNVTSSEKVDKENRYSDFTIISLPYPGCEFFKEYRNNDYVAGGLVFNWAQTHVDASIGIPDDNISSQLKIDWENYKLWDLVTLTQNYMQLVIRYLVDQPQGVLIHCISGWDRTPLFVSLLRLSLWADGAIHQTLTAKQILYFTIAYDWMFFGHNLVDRISKGEDIFFFCFYFLKHMMGDEFSVVRTNSKQRNNTVLRTDSDLQLEGILLDAEAPVCSQGSNMSLNSSWSSISSKSQETPPVFFQAEDQCSINSCDSISCKQAGKQDLNQGNCFLAVPPQANQTSSNNANGVENGLGEKQYPPVPEVKNNSETLSADPNSNTSKISDINIGKINPTRTSPVAVPTRPLNNVRQRSESTSSLSTGSWQFISGTGSLRGSGSNSTCGSHLSSNNSRTPLSDSQLLGDSTTTVIEDECFMYGRNTDAALLRRERLRKIRSLFYKSYCCTVGIKLKDGSRVRGLGNLLGNFAERVGIISTQRTSV